MFTPCEPLFGRVVLSDDARRAHDACMKPDSHFAKASSRFVRWFTPTKTCTSLGPTRRERRRPSAQILGSQHRFEALPLPHLPNAATFKHARTHGARTALTRPHQHALVSQGRGSQTATPLCCAQVNNPRESVRAIPPSTILGVCTDPHTPCTELRRISPPVRGRYQSSRSPCSRTQRRFVRSRGWYALPLPVPVVRAGWVCDRTRPCTSKCSRLTRTPTLSRRS